MLYLAYLNKWWLLLFVLILRPCRKTFEDFFEKVYMHMWGSGGRSRGRGTADSTVSTSPTQGSQGSVPHTEIMS